MISIDAEKFHGNQESQRHKRLKAMICEKLALDPEAEKAGIAQERYTKGMDGTGYTFPDVFAASRCGGPAAFEIQITTAQLPNIVRREDFYAGDCMSCRLSLCPMPRYWIRNMSFADYINGFAPADGTMHLMHSAPVIIGADIILSGELRTRPCTVYTGEDLLYLFYGRPAFKPLPGLPASAIAEHLPMCLVVDPTLLGDAVRILPFDSGGYGRYAAHTGPLVQRADFELGPGCEVPMRLVRAFFETNRNYYIQIATSNDAAIPISQRKAKAFARLSRDPALADDDDRRSTIEVQIGRAVPLATALKAVVAPPVLLSDPEVVRESRAAPIAVHEYRAT